MDHLLDRHQLGKLSVISSRLMVWLISFPSIRDCQMQSIFPNIAQILSPLTTKLSTDYKTGGTCLLDFLLIYLSIYWFYSPPCHASQKQSILANNASTVHLSDRHRFRKLSMLFKAAVYFLLRTSDVTSGRIEDHLDAASVSAFSVWKRNS